MLLVPTKAILSSFCSVKLTLSRILFPFNGQDPFSFKVCLYHSVKLDLAGVGLKSFALAYLNQLFPVPVVS